MSHRVAVIHRGEIVETGDAEQVTTAPRPPTPAPCCCPHPWQTSPSSADAESDAWHPPDSCVADEQPDHTMDNRG